MRGGVEKPPLLWEELEELSGGAVQVSDSERRSIFGLHEPLACCWTKPLVLSTLSKFSFSRTRLHGACLALFFSILAVDILVVVRYQQYQV